MSIQDPFREREAEKYENPIPSREVILNLLSERGQPLDFATLAEALFFHEIAERWAVR